MYDSKTDQQAKANTSDLVEDLGQIEYLFSDKTGTLTENEMEFRQFAVDGRYFKELEGNLFIHDSKVPFNILQVVIFMIKKNEF